MRLHACITVALCLVASNPFAAGKADKRAVEFCVAEDPNFVKVEECLPEAHVAFAVLDAIREVYEAAGSELTERCLTANEGNVTGASACAREAIKAAISLSSKLPDGSEIPDPLFSQLTDPADLEVVTRSANAAKDVFPERLIWGMTVYRELK